MGLLNNLTFDGVKTSDYDVYISGEGTFNAPARRGEFINVPGRNGDLFIDAGSYENIQVEYPAFIFSPYDGIFNEKLQELRAEFKAKRSYRRIEDTYHPDEFRLGLYKEGLEVEPHFLNRSGNFTLIFDCKPQRFLKSGEEPVTFTALGNIENPTQYASLPLIKVTGYGIVTIGDYQMFITEADEPFYIDSELMEAYVPAGETYNFTDESSHIMTDEHGFNITFADGLSTPKNMIEYVTFKDHLFPKIEPGIQPVEISDTIEKLVIYPRWWRL